MILSLENLLVRFKQLLAKLTYRQMFFLSGAVAVIIILYLLRQYWIGLLALLVIAAIVGGIIAWSKYYNNSGDDSDALAVIFTEFKTAIKTAGKLKLPCFVVMGGQGKSQLLQQWAQAVGKMDRLSAQTGTRILDAWIGEHACFIEIGSQYHQQQQPEPSWQAVVKQLKSINSLCPIVGILWILDVPILLNQYRAQALNAPNVAINIAKLTQAVKRSLPTYYIVSQCDRLLGFNEYIHGATVASSKIIGEFNHADFAIDKSLIINQSVAEDLTRQAAAYHFVRQAIKIPALVKVYIQAASLPELAGIFLTSCPDANTTKIICSWEKQLLQLRTITQPNHSYQHSSYFVTDLLPELIQQSLQLLQATSMQSNTKRSGILLLACLLPVITATVYYPFSYINQSRRFQEFQQQLADENQNPQQLINSYQRIDQRQHWPWPLYWGLDPQSKLLPALRTTLNRCVRRDYLQPIQRCVAAKLLAASASAQRHLATSDLGVLYSQLLTYLWLTKQTRLPAAQAEQWLLPVWQTCLPSSTASDLLPWLRYALQYSYDRFSDDPALVQTVVKRLKQIAPSQLVFAQINYLAEKQFGNVRLDDLQVQAMQWSSSISIPALYTQKGYTQWLQPILKHPNLYLSLLAKIIDPNQARVTHQQRRKFRSQIIVAYATAQLHHWQQLLNQIQLSIPLQTETNFFAEESFNKTTLDPLLITLKQQFDWIQEWGSLAHDDSAVKSLQQFRRLIQLNSINQDAAVKTRLTQQFQELQRLLDQVRLSSDPAASAQQITQAILSDQGQTPLKQIYETDLSALQTINNPQVSSLLEPIMLAPVKSVWQDLLTFAIEPIDKQWQQQLYQHYQQHIANHFPLTANGSDVELQDLQDFLQPQTGELWQFVSKYLKNYVEDHDGQYQLHKWLGSGLPVSTTFLQNLNQAKRFALALFGANSEGKQMQLAVQFTPDPHISEVRLLSQGQLITYLNGPERWQQLVWPGPKRLDETSLEVFDARHQHQGIITRSGIWGIFHLLAAANKTQISSQHYLLSWPIKLGKRKITISGLVNIPDWIIQRVALQLPATLANNK